MDAIRSVDKSDALGILLRLPESCTDAVERARRLDLPSAVRIERGREIRYGRPKKIIAVGMGGSAIGGDLLRGWLTGDVAIPIEVCREYRLPAYADENTLVFAVSYSGNTEETVSAFLESVERGCMVVSITSGGLLERYSSSLGVPLIRLPQGMPPRYAIPYLFFPLAVVSERLGVMRGKGERDEAVSVLEQIRDETKPESPTPGNISKKIARSLRGKVPVIYGFGAYAPVALRMKTQFNENSKVMSTYDRFPELNHNEIVGWEAPSKVTKLFSVVLIRDEAEPPPIKTRIEVTKELIMAKAANIQEIWCRGKTTLAKMFSAIYIGDFSSFYLAVLNGVDPTPVTVIDRMKAELQRRANTAEQLEKRFRSLSSRPRSP
jgi:glucose/mannose-6-phosphate isomerase